MLGTSTILNQPIEICIKVTAVSVHSVGKPLTSSLLVVTEYGLIRSMLTCAHDSTSANVAGSLPYFSLPNFLNFWRILQRLTLCSACVINLG